jgi:hypothetical protein
LQIAGNAWTKKNKFFYVLKRLGNNIIVFLAFAWVLLFIAFALKFLPEVNDVSETMILFNRSNGDLVFLFGLIPLWYLVSIVLLSGLFMIIPLRGVIRYNEEEKTLLSYFSRKSKIVIFSHFRKIFRRDSK